MTDSRSSGAPFARKAVVSALERAHDAFVAIRQWSADGARTASFLKERARFLPRTSDVYVATYPRSGTTWMQFLVHLLTSDRRLDFRHISEVTPWFERSLALGTRTAADFSALADPRVFKTHLRPEWVPPGRVIHVERDGRDVARSYYGLYCSHLGYEGSYAEFFDRFMQGRLQYRSWFEHVDAWRRAARERPILWLRYEEVRSQPGVAVDRVAGYLELEPSAEDRAQVLRMISRDFMKAHEGLFDPITEHLIDHGLQPGRFIGSGEGGKSSLSPEQERRYSRRLHEARASRWAPFWRLPDFLH